VAADDSELTREELRVLLSAQGEQISVLRRQVQELEALVAALRAQLGRDSSNSSRPPSSDSPFVKKPAAKRSSRARSGRKPGKQPGAEGSTLELVDDPDDVLEVVPASCSGCGGGLTGAGVFATQRRQVFDVPPTPPRPHVTEYRVCSLECSVCGEVTEGQAPGSASSRTAYGPLLKARATWLVAAHFLPVRRARLTLNALLGCAVSAGFVARLRGRAARILEREFLPAVRALIASAPVAHADETTARAAGALQYLHVACTEHLTAMHIGDRSAATIDAGGIWPGFTGVLVRDGYAGYAHLEQVEHAWCGIHLVRDLRAIDDADAAGQSWAGMMVRTLLRGNALAHSARSAQRDALTDAELASLRSWYHGAIAQGWMENDTGTDPLHEQARVLLRRFERHEDMILRFTVNLHVPFTNNTAELPARAVKVQQRTSGGCWRTLQGLIDFAVVQSYLSTATKWGLDTLDVLERLFTTGPWIPSTLTPSAA
jgi:transposase